MQMEREKKVLLGAVDEKKEMRERFFFRLTAAPRSLPL
jgi:hypothetical protein